MSTPRSAGGLRVSPGWRANDLTPHDVAPLLDNFITKFMPGAPDECWIWCGQRMANGYGIIGRSYRAALLAHRVAFVAFTGEALADNLTIDHLCNTKLCVNPDHLEPVTLAENVRRMNERRGNLTRAESDERITCERCGKTTRRAYMPKHVLRMHPPAVAA